ncbi:hypothetical protein [Variovorax paradoxus]|uniref:hypothetical protein n=1 Tax=Variovorax paradoxus TaxID=34073 RepID=UPI003D657CD0
MGELLFGTAFRRPFRLPVLKAATLSVLLGLAACHSEPPEKPAGNWASFNGFYLGMTLDQAKAIGAANCENKLLPARSIACDIPADKRTLGEMTSQSGVLYFGTDDEQRLFKAQVSFRGYHYNTVCNALARRYGEPRYADGYRWYFHGQPEYIWSKNSAIGSGAMNGMVEFSLHPETVIHDKKYPEVKGGPTGCLKAPS